MGASSQLFSFSYAKSQEEITKAWDRAIDNDKYMNGHDAYSGGIGTMGKGLEFHDKRCKDMKEAEQFILDNHEKWSRAFAVSYFNKKQELKWLIGGWCAE